MKNCRGNMRPETLSSEANKDDSEVWIFSDSINTTTHSRFSALPCCHGWCMNWKRERHEKWETEKHLNFSLVYFSQINILQSSYSHTHRHMFMLTATLSRAMCDRFPQFHLAKQHKKFSPSPQPILRLKRKETTGAFGVLLMSDVILPRWYIDDFLILFLIYLLWYFYNCCQTIRVTREDIFGFSALSFFVSFSRVAKFSIFHVPIMLERKHKIAAKTQFVGRCCWLNISFTFP